MRRVELMRKGLVLAALLLVLTLLPTAPMAAGKPPGKPGPPPEAFEVYFTGHLQTTEPTILEVVKVGWKVTYYGYANITFQERDTTGDHPESMLRWNFFVDRSQEDWLAQFQQIGHNDFGKVWITVDTRSGETWFYYQFDRYLYDETADRYVGWFKYELGGPLGKLFDPADPGGTTVAGEFEIVQMFYYATSNGKKSATGVVYEWRWSGNLQFTISPPTGP